MSINEIVEIVVRVILLIVVLLVIPYIKKKYSNAELDELNTKIMTYVKTADQIMFGATGADKKAWVREKLLGLGIDADIDFINALIESSVYTIHNALKDE